MANIYSKLNNMGKLKLGKITFPGVVIAADLNIDQQYEVINPRGRLGTDGVVDSITDSPGIIYTGLQPRTLSYSILLSTDEEVSEYINDILPNMPYAAINTPVKPLQITHSFANVHGISSVFIDDYTTSAPGSSGWIINLSLMENLRGDNITQDIEVEKDTGSTPAATTTTADRSPLTG